MLANGTQLTISFSIRLYIFKGTVIPLPPIENSLTLAPTFVNIYVMRRLDLFLESTGICPSQIASSKCSELI
jgi:hypothetical protein